MTGHQKFDYATRAFDYSALDFLPKPIEPNALQRAVSRASERQNREQHARQLSLLMDLAVCIEKGRAGFATLSNPE